MKKVRNTLSTLCLLAAAVVVPVKSQAGEILFAMVSDTNAYVTEGLSISNMLAGSGYNVTTRYLNDGVYSDYGLFDQIFVYDLSSEGVHYDKTPEQMANYAGIATWYNTRRSQNLIMDGRILGSCASSDEAWLCNGGDEEGDYIRNYRDQLDLRGGGLVLGTDHEPFTHGINEIASGIGVGGFSGMYDPAPGVSREAYVDPSSPLYLASLDACSQHPDHKCINDYTSTSFVPTGLQVNGQFLNPVAYHGGYHGEENAAFNYAAVSSTMGGLTTLTQCQQGQACVTNIPEPLPIALLVLGLAGLQLHRRFGLSRAAYPAA